MLLATRRYTAIRRFHPGNGGEAMIAVKPMRPEPCTLSIVVPVYNGAKTVGELVDALAALDIPGGHEIVLVNDGSPDNSLAVCRELVRDAARCR